MTHAVIRVRSDIKVRGDISDTMKLLRLNKVNHCVIIPDDAVTKGMLQKCKDYVTWGEVNEETLAKLIMMRGKLVGNHPITLKHIKENSAHDSVVKLAKAIYEGKEKFADMKDAKPVFRLHPPLRGYEGIKRSYKAGGALGYRGEAINDLIVKMLGPKKKEKEKQKPAKKKAVKKVAKKAKKDEPAAAPPLVESPSAAAPPTVERPPAAKKPIAVKKPKATKASEKSSPKAQASEKKEPKATDAPKEKDEKEEKPKPMNKKKVAKTIDTPEESSPKEQASEKENKKEADE